MARAKGLYSHNKRPMRVSRPRALRTALTHLKRGARLGLLAHRQQRRHGALRRAQALLQPHVQRQRPRHALVCGPCSDDGGHCV